MVASEKKQEDSPIARARALFAAGDVREARRAAWAIVQDPDAPEDARAEAARLRARTDVDPRALAIGAAALALAALYIGVFLLG